MTGLSARRWVWVAVAAVAVAWEASARPVVARSLFREPAIRKVAVSPDGNLIAAYAYHEGTHGVLLQVVGSGISTPIYSARDPLELNWVDGDTLLVEVDGPPRNRVMVSLSWR